MLLEVREQRDGLHPLAQPHLVAQDPVEPVLVQADQPVHAHLRACARVGSPGGASRLGAAVQRRSGAHQLVRPHHTARDQLRLWQPRPLDTAVVDRDSALALLLDPVRQELGVGDALVEKALETLDLILLAGLLQLLAIRRDALLLLFLNLLLEPAGGENRL